MVDCSVVGDGGDRIINCMRNLEDRIFQTPFFPCLWRPNTALDACVSVIEGGARRLSFDSAAEIVLLGRLRRVISGRQPAAIGPVNFAKQPTPAARFAGSPELSRLGGLRPLAAPGREPAPGPPGADLLPLGPLSAGGVAAYLTTAAGRAVDRDAVALVHARTGGHPLYLRTLVQVLGVDGLTNAHDPAAVERRLADSPALQHLVAGVLADVPPAQQRLLRVAALLGEISPSQRLVVVEDTSELPLRHPHAVRLEARPPTVDGPGAIDLAQLVRTALRLRPDRIVVGEVRGDEVLALVQAMNTGHDGSIATCHANGPTDALLRLESLVLQAAPTWPLAAIRHQLARSIDVVVHVERHADGRRRITEIAEVTPPSPTSETVRASLRTLAHLDPFGALVIVAAPTRARR